MKPKEGKGGRRRSSVAAGDISNLAKRRGSRVKLPSVAPRGRQGRRGSTFATSKKKEKKQVVLPPIESRFELQEELEEVEELGNQEEDASDGQDINVNIFSHKDDVLNQPLNTEEFLGKDRKTVLSVLNNRENIIQSHLQVALSSARGERNMSSILQQLGDCLYHRGVVTRQANLFPECVALYNAALMQCTDSQRGQTLKSRIKVSTKKFLSLFAGSDRKTHEMYLNSEHSNKFSEMLVSLRKQTWGAVSKIKESWDTISVDDEDSEEDSNKEEEEGKIAEEVKELGGTINTRISDIMKQMCLIVMEVAGRPPCNFAILGLGPLAVGEFTPYSPLEFVILIDETRRQQSKEYFTTFCHLVHMEMLNLGETPLPLTGVKPYKDFYNKNIVAFFDNVAVNGFKLDFSQATHKVTPLGLVANSMLCKQGLDLQLIKCPSDMAAFVKTCTTKPAMQAIAGKLTEVTLLHGNKSLLDLYLKRLHEVMTEEVQGTKLHVKLGLSLTRNLVQNTTLSSILQSSVGCFSQPEPMHVDMLKLSPLLSGLRICHWLPHTTHWDLIDVLQYRLLLSEEASHNLKIIYGISMFTQIAYCCQHSGENGPKELLVSKEQDQIAHIMKQYLFTDCDYTLVRFYETFVPFVEIITPFCKSNTRPLITEDKLLKKRQEIKSFVTLHTMRYDDSLHSLIQDESNTVQNSAISDKTQTLFNIYTNAGMISFMLYKNRKAVSFFMKAMEIKEDMTVTEERRAAFLYTWYNFGLLHENNVKYEKAIKFYKESLEMLNEISVSSKREFSAQVYGSIGRVYKNLGCFKDAIQYLLEAFNLYHNLPQASRYNLNVLSILYMLGELLLQVHDFKKSMVYLRKALELGYQWYGNNCPRLLIVPILRRLGDVYDIGLGKPMMAAIYRHQALKLASYLLGRIEDISEVHTSVRNNKETPKHYNRELINCITELAFCHGVFHQYQDASQGYSIAYDQARNLMSDCVFHVDLAWVLCRKGIADTLAGNVEEAMDSLNRAVDMLKKTKKTDSHLRMLYHKYMGICHSKNNDSSRAVESFKKSQTQLRKMNGDSETIDLCILIELCAEAYGQMNDFSEAKMLMGTSLESRKRVSGQYHQDTGLCLYKLGGICHQQGDNDGAVSCYEESLDIYQRIYGKDIPTPKAAKLQESLGEVHCEMGERDKARSCFLDVINTWRRLYDLQYDGKDGLVTALSRYGDFSRNNQDTDTAIEFHTEALELAKKDPAMGDSVIASLAALVAEDYQELNLYKDAARMFENAISAQRKTTNNQPPDMMQLAAWMGGLGKAYEGLGELEMASKYHMESLKIKKKVLGKGAVDEDMIKSMDHMARAHELRGEYRQAIKLRKQTLEKNKQMHGTGFHPQTVEILRAIAVAYHKLNEFEHSLIYLKQRYQLLDTLSVSDTIEKASTLKLMGSCYVGMGEFNAAREHYENSLKMLKRIHLDVEYHDDILCCLADLASVRTAAGEGQKAVGLLEPYINIVKQRQRKRNSNEISAKLLFNLGSGYESIWQLQKSLSCFKEALKIREGLHGSDPNTSLAVTLRAVGKAECTLGKLDQGIPKLQRAVEMLQQILGQETVRLELAHSIQELGQAFAKVGNTRAAITHLSRSLQMLKQILGHRKSHQYIGRCLGDLAQTYHQAANYDMALTCALDAMQVYQDTLPSDICHPDLGPLAFLVGELHMKARNFDQAFLYYKQASKVALIIHPDSPLHAQVVTAMQKMGQINQLLQTHAKV